MMERETVGQDRRVHSSSNEIRTNPTETVISTENDLRSMIPKNNQLSSEPSNSRRGSRTAKVFFTADTHFGDYHRKIRSRPFSSIREMTQSLIQNWNDVVQDHDTMYHLGDFGVTFNFLSVFRQLHGNKILVRGNADIFPILWLPWIEVHHSVTITVQGQELWLAHKPHKKWPGQKKGVWHLHGHVHGLDSTKLHRCDVGVDCWNFRPIEFAEIKDKIRRMTEKHHTVLPR